MQLHNAPPELNLGKSIYFIVVQGAVENIILVELGLRIQHPDYVLAKFTAENLLLDWSGGSFFLRHCRQQL